MNMDCKHFESMVDDVEREMAPAGARAEALQHVENCPACRAGLAAARVLSLELRALAKDEQNMQGPPNVAASLVSAFRERSRHPAALRRRLSWAGAAAAVVAVGFGFLAQYPRQNSGFCFPATVKQAQSNPGLKTPVPVVKASVQPDHDVVAKRPPGERSRRARSHAAAEPAEPANEFIALSYAGSAYPVGEGIVVRVQLPRSAPALVGLPMSGGDISGTVTADVVLGQDGVARAIRFVRPGEGNTANRNLDINPN